MNDDLISRLDLKKVIAEKLEDRILNIHKIQLLNMISDIIDNAPTVEAFTEDDKALAYCEGYVRGSHEAYTSTQDDMFKCSICGYFGHTHFNFTCPNCGAKMQKGGDKNG